MILYKMMYLEQIEKEFEKHKNKEISVGQKSYMLSKFEFYGIKAPVRREIQKSFLQKQNLPKKEELEEIINGLWNKPQREFQYFALELFLKYIKQIEEKDIFLFESMITNKSWWDTVDLIATKLVGEYFKKFPEKIEFFIKKWINSKNIWLQRTAILFQLKYKEKTDTELLSFIIKSLLGSKEFFINKAIGWALRNYSKTNPQWVKNFVNNTPLDNLSKREALRLIEKA